MLSAEFWSAAASGVDFGASTTVFASCFLPQPYMATRTPMNTRRFITKSPRRQIGDLTILPLRTVGIGRAKKGEQYNLALVDGKRRATMGCAKAWLGEANEY
jgi:hypothetical protein